MGGSKVQTVFFALVAVFLFIVAEFFVPAIREVFRGGIFLLPLVIFSLLGAALLVFIKKEGVTGKRKFFLVLTGVCAVGLSVFVILHNVFYGLGRVISHIEILRILTEAFHVVFFLIAIPACPAGFLVGATGTIVLIIKEK